MQLRHRGRTKYSACLNFEKKIKTLLKILGLLTLWWSTALINKQTKPGTIKSMQNSVRWRSNQFQLTLIWNLDANSKDSACRVRVLLFAPNQLNYYWVCESLTLSRAVFDVLIVHCMYQNFKFTHFNKKVHCCYHIFIWLKNIPYHIHNK